MSYIRSKNIDGRTYYYEQESKRVGGKVITKHLRYIGTTCPQPSGRLYGKVPIKKKYVDLSTLQKKEYMIEYHKITDSNTLTRSERLKALDKLDSKYDIS